MRYLILAFFLLGIATQVNAQGKWIKLAPFPEPSEELLGAAANGKMYVFCGLAPGWKPKALVYEYDPGPDKWTKKKNIPTAVHHQAQAAYNGKIYIFGGCTRAISGEGGTTNVWEFDPVADSYRAMAAMSVKR